MVLHNQCNCVFIIIVDYVMWKKRSVLTARIIRGICTYTLWAERFFFNIKPSGTYTNHWTL